MLADYPDVIAEVAQRLERDKLAAQGIKIEEESNAKDRELEHLAGENTRLREAVKELTEDRHAANGHDGAAKNCNKAGCIRFQGLVD